MPRLPGPESLGSLPSLRPSAPAQISGRSPVAEAAGRVGTGMVALSDDQRQREDALQAAEADAQLTTGLTDLRRRFNTDSDWQTFQPRFEEEANRIRTEAAGRITNDRVRERWTPRADVAVSGAFDHVRGRQDRLRGEHEYDRLDSTLGGLGSSYVTAPDDASRETIRRNIEDTIELGRRSGVLPAERVRDLTRRHLYGTIEADALARHSAGDGYAALIELREGDARAQQPSSGQVSEIGLAYMQGLQGRPAGQTPAQTQAANRRLRTEASQISEWVSGNVTVPLTQLQHDALVGIGVRRGRDALHEMLPSIETGNWGSVADITRAGGLAAMEQPSGTSGGGAARTSLDAVNRALSLTPQEQHFYQHHLNNLYGPGGVDQPDGARSTVRATRFTSRANGRTYIVPTIFNGREVDPRNQEEHDAAIEAAGGLDAFPSYATDKEAADREKAIHDYMERDTQEYQRGRRTGGPRTDAAPARPGDRVGLGQQIMSFFVAQGLSPHQAAAIAGNMAWEGGGRADLVNPGDNVRNSPNSPHSIGIGQWNDRAPALIGFARSQGIDIPQGDLRSVAYARDVIRRIPLETQLAFAWDEMQSTEGRSLAAIRAGADVRTAAAGAIGYHRPAGWTAANPSAGHGFQGRVSLANEILNAGPGTGAAGLPRRDEEIADMLMGQAPSSRYAGLPADRRRVLARQLGESLRNETRAEVESDIESIRRTGEPRRLPDGTTWIERAPRILVPNQAALVTNRVQEAYAQFRATQGLTDMTPEQMENRLDELSPSRTAEGDNYAVAARTRDLAARNVGRINELRQRDPALAVSGTQMTGGRGSQQMGADGQMHNVPAEDDIRVRPAREVAGAFEILQRRRPDLQIRSNQDGLVVVNPPDTGQPIDPARVRPQTLRLTDERLTVDERRLVIEARLAAMSRLGIPEYNRHILRRDEAAELLGMPPRDTDMTDDEFSRRVRAASDRANELFGPRYGRAAFENAIEFRNLSRERRDEAASAMGRRPSGLSEEDRARRLALATLDREQQAWSGAPRYMSEEFETVTGIGPRPFGPVPPSPQRGWFQSAPARPSPGTATTTTRRQEPVGPGLSVSWPKPEPQDIEDIRLYPHRQPIFDGKFGPGAAAAYLQGQAPTRR